MGVVVLEKSKRKRPPVDRDADDELIEMLTSLRGNLPRKECFRTWMRGLTVFDGNLVFLLKPLTLRFWTETAALNDADSLAAAILKFGAKSDV